MAIFLTRKHEGTKARTSQEEASGALQREGVFARIKAVFDVLTTSNELNG